MSAKALVATVVALKSRMKWGNGKALFRNGR
jgi:hypothetical protein